MEQELHFKLPQERRVSIEILRFAASIPYTGILIFTIAVWGVVFWVNGVNRANNLKFVNSILRTKFPEECLATIEARFTKYSGRLEKLCPGYPLNSWTFICSASCFKDLPDIDVQVRYKNVAYKATHIMVHLKRNFVTGENDLALLKVDYSNVTINPVCGGLPPDTFLSDNAGMTVSMDEFSKLKFRAGIPRDLNYCQTSSTEVLSSNSIVCIEIDGGPLITGNGGLFFQNNASTDQIHLTGLFASSVLKAKDNTTILLTDLRQHLQWIEDAKNAIHGVKYM